MTVRRRTPLTADQVGLDTTTLLSPESGDLRASFIHLAERFRASEARGLAATWVITVSGHGAYTIHVDQGRCLISPGAVADPAASLRTDAQTWFDLVAGRVDGVAAFLDGRLEVAGDLHLAVRLDTMFTPGREATRLIRTIHTDVQGVELESLVAGHGTPVLLLHGLAANKLSFLPTFDGLADGWEVHALDLPGFGRSDKPMPFGRRYSAGWMADMVHGYMRANRIRDAYLVGNSMGGRIATEVALRWPGSVRGVAGLGAAVAFDEWQRLGPMLRLIQAEWAAGLTPWPLRQAWVETMLADLFHDPSRVPTQNIRAGAADVVAAASDRGYRMAVACAARRLASERTEGRRGYWTRLEGLRVPSLWIWGKQDRLVSSRYAARVQQVLPQADVQVWDGVGHVPQFEVPERTTQALRDFLTRTEAGR